MTSRPNVLYDAEHGWKGRHSGKDAGMFRRRLMALAQCKYALKTPFCIVSQQPLVSGGPKDATIGQVTAAKV